MALLKFDFLRHSKFNFVKYRYIAFVLQGLFIALPLFGMYMFGLNYGIDFKGGYVLEVQLDKAPSLPHLRGKLEALKIGEVAIQQVGKDTKNLMVKIEKKDNDSALEENMNKIKNILGSDTKYKKVETIGPKVGQELIRNAIRSIIIALIGILIYIAVRFKWQYALSAIIALAHDCIGILILFTLLNFDFNESAIIGILITAGYSINDTIVVFDRIRENMRIKKNLGVPDIINLSINETLSRTVLTVTTTLLSLLAMYIFGGKVIGEFSIPIIFGIFLGTFSSICVAAPYLLVFGLKKQSPLAEQF